jgi:hypothetical protein
LMTATANVHAAVELKPHILLILATTLETSLGYVMLLGV